MRLKGGFMTGKLHTRQLTVVGETSLKSLNLGRRYRLVPGRYLRLTDRQGKAVKGDLQTEQFKTKSLTVTGVSTFGTVRSTKKVTSLVLVANEYVLLQRW